MKINYNLDMETTNSRSQFEVTVPFITDILKKDPQPPSKQSVRVLPYLCIKCKRNVSLVDTASQTNELEKIITRNKTIPTILSDYSEPKASSSSSSSSKIVHL
jgi:hypothetical protein